VPDLQAQSPDIKPQSYRKKAIKFCLKIGTISVGMFVGGARLNKSD
jgi:hypothetical protein